MSGLIFIIIGILCGLIVISGFVVSQLILYPRVRNEEAVYRREIETKRFPEEFYSGLDKEEVWIQSDYGYSLSCTILDNEITRSAEHKHKIAIFCHGYKCSKTASIVYAKILMELGYTALIYDHRNHGSSGKKFTSMGFYEKHDLKKIVDWCYKHYGKKIQVVTHGESMGSATVLSHLTIDQRVTAVIADCGYSDLIDLLKHQLKTYCHLPSQPFLFLSILFIKLRGGFYAKEVSPQLGAYHSKTPILFIHGDSDNYVPTWMTVKMYEKRSGPKQLFLSRGAKHALSCVADYEKYCQVIREFIHSVEDGQYSSTSCEE